MRNQRNRKTSKNNTQQKEIAPPHEQNCGGQVHGVRLNVLLLTNYTNASMVFYFSKEAQFEKSPRVHCRDSKSHPAREHFL